MKTSDDLFQLIKSLSPREKSYFKRFSGLQSSKSDKNYLKLFALMDKQSIYDEKKIKEKIKNESWAKHFSYEKGYLYKLILKSLSSFYADNTYSKKIDTLKQQAVTLLDRSLYDAGMKILQRAIKEARKYELFTQWLALLELELGAIVSKLDWGHMQHVEHYRKERKLVMKQMRNFDEYMRLRFIVFNIQEQEGFVDSIASESFDKLSNHKLLQSPEAALSLRARERYYYIINLMRFVSRDFRKWHKHYPEYIAFMEGNDYLFDINSFSTLYLNHMLACIKTLDEAGFAQSVERMKMKVVKANAKQRANDMGIMYCRVLDMNSHLGNFQAGLDYYHEIKDIVLNDAASYLEFTKQLIYFQITRTLIECGKYEDAQEWINKYQQLGKRSSGSMDMTSRLMFAIIHFALGNTSLVETELRSILRRVSIVRGKDSLQVTMVRFFTKLLSSGVNSKQTRDHVTEFKTDLEQLASDRRLTKFVEYFHVFEWLEATASGRDFQELVLEKVARRKQKVAG